MQKIKLQPLVSELWAIRGHCEEIRAQKIAKRAKLPLQWLDKMPALNGSKGIEKLRAERGVWAAILPLWAINTGWRLTNKLPRELKKYLPSPEEMIERIKYLE